MTSTSISIPAKPLLAALVLALATTACQREETPVTTPSDDATSIVPVDTAPAPLPPPETDPCTNLVGTELDECLRRTSTPTITPPPSEQLPPVEDPQPIEPEETQAPPPA